MYLKTLTAIDLDTAARTVWGEARGEGVEGMKAIAWVIRNRSEIDLWEDSKPDWWGETIDEVCKKVWQFSCWNENDPNRGKMEKLGTRYVAYKLALSAVCQVLVSSKSEDPTKGAFHHHTKSISPHWAKGKQPCAEIGDHVFYNDIDGGT